MSNFPIRNGGGDDDDGNGVCVGKTEKEREKEKQEQFNQSMCNVLQEIHDTKFNTSKVKKQVEILGSFDI